MGMAASQGRLLTLTARKNSIGFQLEGLSMQKMSLSREMQKVSKEYNTGLNAKRFKWSNNSGVDYVDLSYGAIMRPSAVNQNKPYLISDTNGRVVLNKKYKDLAEKFSPNGLPVGASEYEAKRNEILSQLGLSSEGINSMETAKTARDDANKALNEARNKWQDKLSNEPTGTNTKDTGYKSIEDLLKLIKSEVGLDKEVPFVADDKDKSGWWGFHSKALDKYYSNSEEEQYKKDMQEWAKTHDTPLRVKAGEIIDQIFKALSKYFVNDSSGALGSEASDNDKFKSVCDTIKGTIFPYGATPEALYKDNKINVEEILRQIMHDYQNPTEGNGPSKSSKQSTNGETKYFLRNTSDSSWKKWKSELDEAYKNYKSVEDTYTKAQTEYENNALSAQDNTELKFYDTLFYSIAEKGWVYDAQIEDNDYLNNMFQNNQFYITQVTENGNYDPDEKNLSYKQNKYNYDTAAATNFDKMYLVNDEDSRQEALTIYEDKKARIKIKEQRIDTRMKDLETEQSAINNMIKGIETVRNDNVEAYFSIFS